MADLKWLDLANYRLELRIAEFSQPVSARVLVLRGQNVLAPAQSEALRASGFVDRSRAEGGFRTMWMREGSSFGGDEPFLAAFPQARRVTWPRERISLEVAGPSPFARKAPPPVVPAAPDALAALRGGPQDGTAAVAKAVPAGPQPAAVPARVAPMSPFGRMRTAPAPVSAAPAAAPASAPAVPAQSVPAPVLSSPAAPSVLARPFGMMGRRMGAAPSAVQPEAARTPDPRLPPREIVAPPAKPEVPAAAARADVPVKPKPAMPRSMSMARSTPREEAALDGGVPEVEFYEEGLEALHAVSQVNRFQARYEPESKVGKPIAMIPLNMSAQTKAALQRIVSQHGDIDRWIAKRARWKYSELADFVSPEQVDAVALMMFAIDQGKGSILADQTGLGKGRVLATVARICAIEKKRVVFLTEKANLFSDFWRDVIDTGSDKYLGAPFILNDKAVVVDANTPDGVAKVLFNALKPAENAKIIKSGKLPKGTRLVMATYSQFNRKNSPKALFLASIAKDAVAMRDESHNAAGESNVGAALNIAFSQAAAVVHSSATFARDAMNLQSYGSVLPGSLREADLSALFRTGGNAFAEALSQALAEEGVLIRREHDLSNIRIEVVDDLENMGRNREYSDSLSDILSGMAVLSRRVAELADERNNENADVVAALPPGEKKSAREKWYTMNFGAVLAALVRQVVTAMKVDQSVEQCVSILARGEKPVVVIETTMEALMRDLMRGVMSGEEGTVDAASAPPVAMPRNANGTYRALLPGDVPTKAEAVDAPDAEDPLESETAIVPEGAKPPDYRDALNLALIRLTELIVRRGAEDPERVPIDAPDVVAAKKNLSDAIAGLADLSLSPIDDLRERIEARGAELFARGEIDHAWKVDEISARSMRVSEGKYETMPSRDRNSVIAGFNGGKTDMVIVTRAGSTGLSLHASEKVRDQRRRIMVEHQIPSNVVERVQFWGRVNRRGQVSEPGFMTLSTGLPIEARSLAMQNRKVAQLSANVSASADNATSMDVPDILDKVGNEICRRILTERPALADQMCIAMRGIDEEEAEEELYHVNKLLQRLVLLKADAQTALYEEVIELYDDAMREMEAQGRHPQNGRELPGSWTVESRELFDAGNPADGPVFGRPVWIATLKGMRDFQPLGSVRLQGMAFEAGLRLAAEYGEPNDMGYFAAKVSAIRGRLDELLEAAVPKGFGSAKEALSGVKANAVKVRRDSLQELRALIAKARPGVWLTAPDDDGVPAVAYVVDVRAPDDDGAHHAGRWFLRYAFPGDEKPREVSFSTIMRQTVYNLQVVSSESESRRLLARYDAAPNGLVEERRKMLDGNLVAAVRLAAEGRMGSAASWIDDEGRRRRGVLIPKNRQNEVSFLQGSTFCAEAAYEILKRGARLESSPSKPLEGVTFESEVGAHGQGPGRLSITLPMEPKPLADRLRGIFEKVGVNFEAGQNIMVARGQLDRALPLLKAYLDSSRCVYFPGRYRVLALSATRSLRDQAEARRDAAVPEEESEPAPSMSP